jgi:hypothetical protein
MIERSRHEQEAESVIAAITETTEKRHDKALDKLLAPYAPPSALSMPHERISIEIDADDVKKRNVRRQDVSLLIFDEKNKASKALIPILAKAAFPDAIGAEPIQTPLFVRRSDDPELNFATDDEIVRFPCKRAEPDGAIAVRRKYLSQGVILPEAKGVGKRAGIRQAIFPAALHLLREPNVAAIGGHVLLRKDKDDGSLFLDVVLIKPSFDGNGNLDIRRLDVVAAMRVDLVLTSAAAIDGNIEESLVLNILAANRGRPMTRRQIAERADGVRVNAAIEKMILSGILVGAADAPGRLRVKN